MYSSRMKQAQLWSAAAVVAFATACGGAKPTPNGPTPVTEAPAVDEGASVPENVDLSPVAAPPGVFVLGRVKSPSGSLDTVSKWAKLPMDWRQMIAEEEPGILEVVDLDAPLDFVMAVDSSNLFAGFEPQVAFSIGVVSMDAALERAREDGKGATRLRPGVYRIDDDCAVAASRGKAPARIVCGDGSKSLDALLDYVTRGLPDEKLGDADARLEIHAEPLRKMYGGMLERGRAVVVPTILNELQIGDPRFDRAMAEAVHALADEVLDLIFDADRVVISLSADRNNQSIEAEATFALKGSRSWVAQTLNERGKRAAAAPEIFWSLPRGSTSASFAHGGDPKRFEPIRGRLVDLADAGLAKMQAPPRVRQSLVRLIETLPSNSASTAYAGGSLGGQVDLKSMTRPDRNREMVRQGIGWHVVGIDTAAKDYSKFLDDVRRVATSRDFKRYLSSTGFPMDEYPEVRRRAARGRGLSPGTQAYEVVVPGAVFASKWAQPPNDKGKALSVVLVVMPDGKRTWFGLSADEKLLTSKLAQVRSSAKADGKISKAGLEQLQKTKVLSGGFSTLQSAVEGFGPMTTGVLRTVGVDLKKMASRLPNRGRSPMIYTVTTGAGPSLTLRFEAPKGAVEDVTQLVVQGFMMFGEDSSMTMPAPVAPPMAPPPPPRTSP